MDGNREKGIRHRSEKRFISSEMRGIMERVSKECEDPDIENSIYISPTFISHVRRVLERGGAVFADTQILRSELQQLLPSDGGLAVRCLIDDPAVAAAAQQRRITRAEVAVDKALAEEDTLLYVIASAPTALRAILRHRRLRPLTDLCVIAAFTGFAGAVQIKESLMDSGVSCIAVRGRKGSLRIASSLFANALKEACTST